ncbi:MAG: acpP [Bacillales bacterium]|nr:acpP [Bacillales bacterium]
MTNVFEQVQKIIVERLNVEPSKVTLEAAFKEDLGADSLNLVEIAMELEDQFQKELSDDELENIVTVGDAVNFIEAKM